MEFLEYLEELENQVQMLLPLLGEYLDQHLNIEQVDQLLSVDNSQPEEPGDLHSVSYIL